MRKHADARPLAVFRFDATPEIGGGHAIRCFALIHALLTQDWRCHVVATESSAATITRLAPAGVELSTVPDVSAIDAEALKKTEADGCMLLVVDHYGWSAEQTKRCRNWAQCILVIDDLCNRAHDCDLLLDVALDRRAADYAAWVPNSTHLLLNPGYALLREEFAALRLSSPPRAGLEDGARIFLNFGLLDSANVTERALASLESIEHRGSIQVIMGSGSPHLARIRARIDKSPLRATLTVDPTNIATLMAQSDLAVGAAGGIAWERCCLGLPSLIVVAAENQKDNAATLAKHGASEWLSIDEMTSLSARLSALIHDRGRLSQMADAARSLTDGLGARRVAIAVAPEKTPTGEVSLRRTTMEDAELLLDWQRHPETRRYSRNPNIPELNEHKQWLSQKLKDTGSVLNIIEYNGRAAGALRFDQVATAPSENTFEVSIYIDPQLTGKGIGRAALAAGRRLLPEATFIAHVHADNKPSHTLFQAAGYVGERDHYVQRAVARATHSA